MAARRADSSTDPSIAIPRDEDGCTPDPYEPGNGNVRTNFGTQDGDAHLRPTKAVPGGVASGKPQPRTDGR